MVAILFRSQCVNILWLSYAMCRQRYDGRHQCWLIISEVLWHSHEDNSTGNAQDIYPWSLDMNLKITTLRLQPHLPGASELMVSREYINIEVISAASIGCRTIIGTSSVKDWPWQQERWHKIIDALEITTFLTSAPEISHGTRQVALNTPKDQLWKYKLLFIQFSPYTAHHNIRQGIQLHIPVKSRHRNWYNH